MNDILDTIWECANSYSNKPFYLYDLQEINSNAIFFLKNFDIVSYPYKSSSILDIVQFLHKLGLWAEVSSKEEYIISKQYTNNTICNFPYYIDLNFNLSQDTIFVFNSIYDLLNYNEKVDNIGIRLQVSNNSRFGINDSELIRTANMLSIFSTKVKLLHFHIGTNIIDLNIYKKSILKSCKIIDYLNSIGCNIEYLDIGGGFPTNPPIINPRLRIDVSEYISNIKNFLEEYISIYSLDVKVIVEPGRAILVPGSYLVAKVTHIKNRYVFLNIGSTHLPSSRYLVHNVSVISKHGEEKTEQEMIYSVVGSLCYDDDIIFTSKYLPRLEVGDLVIIHDVGAYSANMAPEFFILPKPKIFVFDGTSLNEGIEFKDVL